MDNLKKLLPLIVVGALIWFAVTRVKNELVSKVVTTVGLIIAVPMVARLLPANVRGFLGV